MREVRGIAFDLEGTVVNVEPAHHGAWLQLAQELGLSLTLGECLQGALPHFIGGPDEAVCQELLGLLDTNSEGVTVASLVGRKRSLYRTILQHMTILPRSGWGQVYHAVEGLRLRMSIGSATAREEATVLLVRSGLVNLFLPQRIILAEDVRDQKPAPDVFLMTAARMGIHPSEQVVFEDSPRGVKAALAAGSVAVGMPVYDRPGVHQALLQAGAFRTFRSWEEINLIDLLLEIQRVA